MAILGHLDLRAMLDHRDPEDPLDYQETMENVGRRVPKAPQEHPGEMDVQVSPEHKDHMALRALLVHQVNQVRTGLLDHRDIWVRRVIKEMMGMKA